MQTIQDSLAFLKQQKWVDLTHQVTPTIPYFSAFKPLQTTTLTTVAADGYYANQYHLVTQYGTHVDAPNHFVDGLRAIDELELQEMVLPLYVLHKEKEVAENPDYMITVEDIYEFENQYGQIKPNSFVAFASDWSKRWLDPTAFYNVDEENQAHTPGWSVAALKFLHEQRQVKAIGHETLDTDPAVVCTKNGGLMAELYWLSQNHYQVEVLCQLSQIPATGAIIAISVPKIKGAPGFTSRAFAIMPTG